MLFIMRIFFKTCKKSSIYEKIKMFKKGPFVIESFVTVASFDYDCTHIPNFLDPSNFRTT